ncbi:MAG: hypothetical protein F6K50_06990 [Moorea sp. SIO3I7]|uniref:hypothetical protein n=1 Tax=unclassified Moorena TaxID=2683338 RepID=UPI0013C04BF6|nr:MULTISPECIES: hypothetical protein [unclassified Moorena]NEN95284.1 hypothetical protein [Moorena sp. SIO3I7]NEO04645.1 hypothetical protein [Moorena sp. SIO3I8]NEO19802.1 hypothetical protein [Moorena sp. SIO4A5]NEP24419.1 hypothetical protein [Moorena sp. SIO3I6]NEQ56606.1 hypothetical protein [Moorena sp. SIO4A1]
MKTTITEPKSAKTVNSFDATKEVHKLSGKADHLKQYYDQWSRAYDQDVENEDYCGPDYIAAYLDLLPKHDGKFLNFPNLEIECFCERLDYTMIC